MTKQKLIPIIVNHKNNLLLYTSYIGSIGPTELLWWLPR